MVAATIEEISKLFEQGESVQVPGFGTFEVKKRLERVVVIPGTDKRMLVPPKLILAFRPVAAIKEELKGRNSQQTASDAQRSTPSGATTSLSAPLKAAAGSLETKFGLEGRAAALFVRQLFNVITDGLQSDRVVKIKGLGTFKVTSVAARRSVDVNTGNPITIEGRDKVAFTPENSLRDRVNSPFAQFDTVELNDGVDLSKIDNAAVPEDTIPSATQETALSPKVSEPNKPITPTESTEPIMPIEPTVPITPTEPTEPNEPTGSPPKKSYLTTIIVAMVSTILVLGLVTVVALFYNKLQSQNHQIQNLQAKLAKPSTTAKPAKMTPAPTATPSKPSEPACAEEPKNAQPTKPVQQTEDEKIAEWNADTRIRHGAYRIIGIAGKQKVKKGQTIASIAKANFGPGMDCYIEAVNPGVKTIKPGDEINIPEIKLKKKRKQ